MPTCKFGGVRYLASVAIFPALHGTEYQSPGITPVTKQLISNAFSEQATLVRQIASCTNGTTIVCYNHGCTGRTRGAKWTKPNYAHTQPY